VRRIVSALVVITGLALSAAPAGAQAPTVAADLLYAVLPITPDQAREVSALLQTPGAVTVDLVDVTGVVLDTVPSLPEALLHDVLATPSRHLRLLHAVVTDVLDVGAPPKGEAGGLFRHTIRALHGSATLSAAADALRRVTHPKNRTARLAIVLTARAYGVPLDTADLDLVRRAIDRDAPDLAPLLARAVERLVHLYGRDAVRLLLRS
jgi:hypothetical protein